MCLVEERVPRHGNTPKTFRLLAAHLDDTRECPQRTTEQRRQGISRMTAVPLNRSWARSDRARSTLSKG